MANWFSKLFQGTPEKHARVSTLLPEQQALSNQLFQASQRPGAGGAFGDVADYYRGNLSNDPRDFQAMAAPEMRNFNQNIIPGLSEQFAGMGSGGLSSSGFRNAAVNAGTDLSERLGAIRAQLRQQSAQGLQGLASQGMGNYSQDVMTQQGSPGLLSQAGPALGAMGSALFGPAGSVVGGALGNWTAQRFGQTKPY
jgi:hypothetical protein